MLGGAWWCFRWCLVGWWWFIESLVGAWCLGTGEVVHRVRVLVGGAVVA